MFYAIKKSNGFLLSGSIDALHQSNFPSILKIDKVIKNVNIKWKSKIKL